jgi:RimJ/RimL family protein N-acetyltransferase
MILETTRLILRPLTADDMGFMARMWTDPEVCRFIGGVKTPEQARQKIQDAIDHQQRHGFGRWAVELKTTGELLGLCGPMNREIGGVIEVELGYAFAQPYWGLGYATEAATAAVAHCLGALGQPRVVAIIHPGNQVSLGVIAKAGMTFERMVDWEGRAVKLYAASLYGAAAG